MKVAAILLLAVVALTSTQLGAAQPSAWAVYNRSLEQSCPGRHVDWVFDGGYGDLLFAFELTLPAQTRGKIMQVADLKHRCASETIGFACEFGWSLEAYRRLGVLKRFVSYGCDHVRCEEAALCSEFPKPPH